MESVTELSQLVVAEQLAWYLEARSSHVPKHLNLQLHSEGAIPVVLFTDSWHAEVLNDKKYFSNDLGVMGRERKSTKTHFCPVWNLIVVPSTTLTQREEEEKQELVGTGSQGREALGFI